ncbi:MAG: dihydropteroate synthase [Muribaculaceae bacterium]|nr:dihydropteroate synthase [Muribaculaceae bacterium]
MTLSASNTPSRKTKLSLTLGNRAVEFDRPVIMGIVNATPDSFYAGARNASEATIERLLAEGADILDIGACSTRPGADPVSAAEEWRRMEPVLKAARRLAPEIPISIDTFRADVARRALDAGADIINDISGGTFDPLMDRLAAERRVPYIIMHMRGNSSTMQTLTDYDSQGGVTAAVIRFLARRISELADMGVKDIIVDPGFGFAKTIEQNFQLLNNLQLIADTLQRPMLVGLSRKSMFYKPLGLGPDDVLPQTAAANRLAVERGAAILRVHDPAHALPH